MWRYPDSCVQLCFWPGGNFKLHSYRSESDRYGFLLKMLGFGFNSLSPRTCEAATMLRMAVQVEANRIGDMPGERAPTQGNWRGLGSGQVGVHTNLP